MDDIVSNLCFLVFTNYLRHELWLLSVSGCAAMVSNLRLLPLSDLILLDDVKKLFLTVHDSIFSPSIIASMIVYLLTFGACALSMTKRWRYYCNVSSSFACNYGGPLLYTFLVGTLGSWPVASPEAAASNR